MRFKLVFDPFQALALSVVCRCVIFTLLSLFEIVCCFEVKLRNRCNIRVYYEEMASSIKYQWCLSKYAKFVFDEDKNGIVDDDIAEILDVPCKGKWKVHTNTGKDLLLFLLESDHFLITHNDVILESFSLINSKTWLKGVAKKDSLLILNKLKEDNNRRFRIQFNGEESERKQCTEILRRYFPICDYDVQSNNCHSETESINQTVFDKLKFRKGYDVDLSDENLKEIVMLCLTDVTFPSYVAKVDEILQSIGK